MKMVIFTILTTFTIAFAEQGNEWCEEEAEKIMAAEELNYEALQKEWLKKFVLDYGRQPMSDYELKVYIIKTCKQVNKVTKT